MAPVAPRRTERNAPVTPATTKGESDRFCMLMGRLPQELSDQIFELTLTIDKDPDYGVGTADGTVVIHEAYKPPAQLQLDKKTRERTLRAFYHRTTFDIHKASPPTTEYQRAILVRWLRSLPAEMAHGIAKIRYHSMLMYVYYESDPYDWYHKLPGETYRGSIKSLLGEIRLQDAKRLERRAKKSFDAYRSMTTMT